MKLRYDPFRVFRLSKTPAGLYARQKWLGEVETTRWKTDFQETVAALLADQMSDGSWHHAAVETLTHLFGLHLTVRTCTPQIDAALNWLLEKIDLQKEKLNVSSEDVAADANLPGLPFIQSRPDMFLTGAALFTATIFGRESDPDVLALYQWLSRQGLKSSCFVSSIYGMHNHGAKNVMK